MSLYYFLTNRVCFDGAAIATVVTVAEILKNNGLAVEKSKFFPVMNIATHMKTDLPLDSHCFNGELGLNEACNIFK